tara:strand:+ start:413 stop:550 length:138 start_codon:yes stop_codon:yes gene_type:complete
MNLNLIFLNAAHIEEKARINIPLTDEYDYDIFLKEKKKNYLMVET